MKLSNITVKKIYNGSFLLLLMWIVTGLLSYWVAPDLKDSLIILGGSIPTVCFLSFYLTEGKQRIVPTAIITAVIISFIYFNGLTESEFYLIDYFQSIGKITSDIQFQIINLILLGVLLIPFLLMIVKSLRLRAIAGVIIFVYLIIALFLRLELSKIVVSICLLLLIIIITEYLQKFAQRQKTIVYLLPFFIIYFIALFLLPAKNEPYDWQIIKNIYSNIRQSVQKTSYRIGNIFDRDSGGFGMEVVGFSGSGEIRNKRFRAKERDVMEVALFKGKRMGVNLTGNIFDTFDGENWTALAKETKYDHVMDVMETLYAVYRHDEERIKDYLNIAEIEIKYTGLRTEYIFAPLKSRYMNIPGIIRVDLHERGGEWRVSQKKGSGTTYRFSYFQMNMGQDYFREMILNEVGYDYRDSIAEDFYLDYYLSNITDIPLNQFNFTSQVMRERSESIYNEYMSLYPFSNEVLNLLAQITKDAENEYEMLIALEQTLAGYADIPFTYTKNPEQLPLGKDFFDYFLLESREGYCTYYASAFVLLAREMGMPARYVQGYSVSDEHLGAEVVTVTDHMAHAWAEVYFRGVGWIPFEPTPGFGNARYRYWNPTDSTGSAVSNMPPVKEEEISTEIIEPVIVDGETDLRRRFEIVFVVLLVLIITCAMIIIIDKIIKGRTYNRMSTAKRFIVQTNLNFYILAMAGFRLNSGETLTEFGKRVSLKENGIILDFIKPFEKMIYRGDMVDDEVITISLNDRAEIYRFIRNKSKWLYYYVRFRIFWYR
ncbi:MAG: transglutaminase domain-containing protein [Lachnospiraceae bacterium]|nr:transglutaminase domain-containing protein [Lachnospiraceae bacterium]